MKDPAFPLYAQDFLMGTMFMELADVGRYIKLLAFQWDNFNIPKKRLGLLVGLSWENFSPDLREKFSEFEDYILNIRLEEEREKRKQFKDKQAVNGKKGGRPKNPSLLSGLTQKNPLEDENEYEEEDVIVEEEKGITKGKNKFIIPHLDQIIAYCNERQNNVDPVTWHNFYSSKGWMIGKNKMKDWKAAVRTWENNQTQQNGTAKTKQLSSNSNSGVSDDYKRSILERLHGSGS
jgi:uncharacterized protein YdaU (DUF1376 family)